jgi:hypothetical protein
VLINAWSICIYATGMLSPKSTCPNNPSTIQKRWKTVAAAVAVANQKKTQDRGSMRTFPSAPDR